ncbi:DEAD/DEAH box helicase family protein [Planktothrix sp. FACHB-1355]|uniref:DEAD/DEAH box helicase family protein n=1 Tax=Aerosakkonema funiforme FACHB-1375 TaxID=2949571 RepID=A0A926VLG4_9CYAN|nr:MULTISPECIES: DEAD/DEAH box helicase family protein [Oscillatoriales]MBD2186100.1 DEAD/DEAH box helicase family protein [Aerosakkonema funiforme FACHB-1375]MBD3561136.1 DEAD/DEAH box helicase family protein [Planktothrix sp. FACHB-1355]
MQDFPTLPVTHVPIYQSWPLYNLDILPPGVPPPSLAELKAEQWRSYAFNLDRVDLVVVNRQFLVNLLDRGEINPANVGLLIIDEAHHASAASYTKIINYFNSSLLVFLTGSRFRSDSKPIPHIQYTTIEDTSETGQIITR